MSNALHVLMDGRGCRNIIRPDENSVSASRAIIRLIAWIAIDVIRNI